MPKTGRIEKYRFENKLGSYNYPEKSCYKKIPKLVSIICTLMLYQSFNIMEEK
jgi:hypothetical protein